MTLIPPEPETNSFHLNKVGVGACVAARGQWISRSDGQHELEVRQPSDWEVVGPCDLSSYPLQKKQHSAEFIRTELLHLRPRTRRFAATTRIRNHLSHQLNCSLQDRGYMHIHTPLLTSADCEGAGELFRVAAPSDFAPIPPNPDASSVDQTPTTRTPTISDRMLLPPRKSFFKQPTFLSVSGQLHLEAFASSSPGVYAFGPIFRADPSNTSNHLSEFWMLEPELSFADLNDAMDLCEHLVQSAVRAVVEHPERSKDLNTVFLSTESIETEANDESGLPSHELAEQRIKKTLEPFARMTYTEAVTRLGLEWGTDLERKHEKLLCEEYCGGRPLFLTDYPAAIKPFYMRANNCEDPDRKTVACMDLLLPGLGEVAGGSAREERYEILQPRINSNEQLKKQLGWYLDLRRYGTFPHAGFGIGFDRLVQFVTQTPNIRDVIPFPRSKGRCDL